MMQQTIDQIPLWAVFMITTIMLFAAAEAGFQLGKWRKRRSKDEEKGLTGTIIGAELGMLAFMLAFTFGMAGSINDARKKMVVEEATAIKTAHMRAQIIPEPTSSKVKGLLHDYVDVRIKAPQSIDNVEQAIARSEELLDELWALAVSLAKENTRSIFTGRFVDSLNTVIDIHSKRIAAALRNRIPMSIGITLYFVAILAMATMGYQGGLTEVHTLATRSILILAFASVMLLIVELDRPGRTMVKINQQAMLDVRTYMDKEKR